jgi:hypothetical protein
VEECGSAEGDSIFVANVVGQNPYKVESVEEGSEAQWGGGWVYFVWGDK